MYINNQQIYNTNGLYAHKSYISNNFKGASSEYKGVLHCEGYAYEEILHEIIEAPLSEPFFTRRMKSLADLMASCCLVDCGLTFPPLLNCYIQTR